MRERGTSYIWLLLLFPKLSTDYFLYALTGRLRGGSSGKMKCPLVENLGVSCIRSRSLSGSAATGSSWEFLNENWYASLIGSCLFITYSIWSKVCLYRSDLAEEPLLAELLEVLLLHLEHIAPAVEDIVVVAILQVADFV